MKRILITLVALTMFVSVAFGGYCETKAFPITSAVTADGFSHGATACTVDIYDYLYGANFARFTIHADTIVDTASYYFFEMQFKPVAGAAWGASVPIGVDSILITTASTNMVSDTLDLGGPEVFLMTYGSNQLARVISYPTVLTAKQGMQNCTLYITRYKE